MKVIHLFPQVPKRLAPTAKVPNTRGCYKCCYGRNAYNGFKYLCGALPNGIILMQWYDPLNKYMLLKVSWGKGEGRCWTRYAPVNRYVIFFFLALICSLPSLKQHQYDYKKVLLFQRVSWCFGLFFEKRNALVKDIRTAESPFGFCRSSLLL